MKRTKAIALTALMALGGQAAPVWASGIPTVDVAVVSQMMVQYQTLLEQLGQLQQQYEQQVRQLESMTGSRGYGSTSRLDLSDYLPENMSDLYGSGSSGYGAIADQIGAFITAEEFTGTPSEYNSYIQERERNSNAVTQLSIQRAYKGAQERLANLETLADNINGTDDMKAVEELQARIQIEQAGIENELTKIALMQQAQVSEQEMIAQQRREMARKVYSSSIEGQPSIN